MFLGGLRWGSSCFIVVALRLGVADLKPRKSRPGGVPHRILGPKMEQISILDALVALELSWWRLGKFEKVSGRRFGTVLSGSWVPTWVPKWSQLDQKIDPKINHFLDASWNLFVDGC